MYGPRRRVTALAVTLVFAAIASLFAAGGSASAAPEDDGFHLVRPTRSVEAQAFRGRVFVSLPVLIAGYGTGMRVDVGRPDFDTRISATMTVITDEGETTRSVPRSLVNDYSGFDDAVRIVITDDDGDVVSRRKLPWCPNSYSRQRVDTTGPAEPEYPEMCGAHPFTMGMVWGLEQGWAAPLVEFMTFRAPAGEYTATVKITKALAELLGIPPADRSTTVEIEVAASRPRPPRPEPKPPIIDEPLLPLAVDDGISPRHSTTPRPVPPIATGAPDPDTLPDLVSLPAYGISTTTGRNGKDRLAFFANEWNAGPAPMVIEGFRRGSRALMDTYQALYDGDEVAEWREVGQMEFHEAPQHNHWHFLDFAAYDLVDRDGNRVSKSGKQSWCLVPTDAIDLRVPGAVYRPGQTGLDTACGGPEAMWIRETLPVGWGDTYAQFQTQAIDITDVPNGTYGLRIRVNPTGALWEVTRDNNTSLRRVILGGEPGARTVRVPAYGLVDTDGRGPGGGDRPVEPPIVID